MCGRFVVSYTYDELMQLLNGDISIENEVDISQFPLYNIAPTHRILSVITSKDRYRAGYFKWGYTMDSSLVVNAKSETIIHKPLFEKDVRQRRCVVIASGYYEWKATEHGKQPYYIYQHQDKPILFAGVYRKVQKGNVTQYECVIITKQAEEQLLHIHERMPLMLKPAQVKSWLQSTDDYLHLLDQPSAINIEYHPVGTYVNNVLHQGEECIKETEDILSLF